MEEKKSNVLIEQNISKRAGLTTPSYKALYDRLGVAVDEEQSVPWYNGKNITIAKLASAMIQVGVLELQRAKFEKENNRVIQIRNVEQDDAENLYDQKIKELKK